MKRRKTSRPARPPGAAVERRGRKKGAPRPSSDQILDAAEQVFARQGYADTSLRELMAAARVSTTAFYARFASRDAVLEAVVARFMDGLAAATAERLAAARGIEEGFILGVDVLVEAVADRRALMRLLLGEASGSPVVRRRLGTELAQLAGLLGANLERLADKGIVEPADARAVGWAFVGALKIQLERWALYDGLETRDLAASLASTARALLPTIRRRGRPA